ncbi:MAG TPA: AAA family ATPase [Planctomycetota bacterium]|nr:AAA family ATPase [Planctomycetota bacterium]
MRETKAALVALETLHAEAWPPPVRELLDAVVDVARRLSHNVVGLEHLLIVGAENGVESMAHVVPGLAAFREALLDALHDDRDSFRRRAPAGAEAQVFVRPALLALLQRVRAGEPATKLMAETMESDLPRIVRALSFARGTEPDVLPPDTIALEKERAWDPSLATGAGADADADADATDSGEDGSPQRTGGEPRTLPLTSDLCKSAADDLPLVGRGTLVGQAARILLRFHEPVVVIVGEPGSGKTAFVRGLARAACAGELPALTGFRFHELHIIDLVAQSHRGQDIHNLIDQLLGRIAADPKAVLVVDDLQLLLAKQGYPMISDVIDTVKMHIKRGRLRALLTVDSAEYEKSFSSDATFGGEVSVRRLPPLLREDLAAILGNLRPRLQEHFQVAIGDDAIAATVTLSLAEQAPDYRPPGATVRLLDEACALSRATGAATVSAAQVEQAAHEETPSSIASWDRNRLAHLADALKELVLGQDLAAEALARRVRLSKLHMDRKPNRPDGVFLFIGPSGVGKTEMARGLARALYDDESRLVRLDMSEYMEPHSVARIIGAPPGYVGYGEDGALTAPVSRMGHGVVLLDEIEKAHPQVLNLFLQVFDEGRLTDSRGRTVDFSDTVIIMTSNIGRELYAIHGARAIGFGAEARRAAVPGPLRDAVQEYLLRVLPSEFVNRIDEIVPFRVLEDADIRAIAQRLLVAEALRWKTRGKELTWEPAVADVIATSGYDPRLGARHVERNLERLVISLLSDAAVTEGFESARHLHLQLEDGALCLVVDEGRLECLPHGGRLLPGPAGAAGGQPGLASGTPAPGPAEGKLPGAGEDAPRRRLSAKKKPRSP